MWIVTVWIRLDAPAVKLYATYGFENLETYAVGLAQIKQWTAGSQWFLTAHEVVLLEKKL